MEVKKLHFFDKSGYELNFEWNEYLNCWDGNIYLPKVSVGLYSNTSIYVLEEITDNNGNKKYIFPKSSNGSEKVRFHWDILNKFVDEFFMFTFDTSFIQNETSALTYRENDGPDCEPVLITRFDNYEINLETKNVNKALPIHVAFTSPEKENANTFKRTLVMEYNFKTIANITFYAETIEEDERLKALNYNLGYNLSKKDELIFKKSNIKEPKPDFNLLNEKRKELMINGHNIYPFLGSYKALINALKFFGYNNLNIIDIWKNINEYSENYGKSYYVKKYTLTDSEVVYTNEHGINLPSSDFNKSPNIALSYYINKPKNEFDIFELPYTEEKWDYTLEEALIKLFALRTKLNKEFLPSRSRIIDIIGEASYFGICGVLNNIQIGSTSTFENGINISISAFPDEIIRLNKNKKFHDYILKSNINNWNIDNIGAQSLLENIDMSSLTDSDSDSDNSIINYYKTNIYELVKSENEWCDYYYGFYHELNDIYSIKDNTVDDLNDNDKIYKYVLSYSDGSVDKIEINESINFNDDDIEELVILNDVDSLLSSSLNYIKNLKKIVIYNGTITSKKVFNNCTKLEEVILSKSIKFPEAYSNSKYTVNNTKFVIKYEGSQEEWEKINNNYLLNHNHMIYDYNINNEYKTNLSAKIILTNTSLPIYTFDNIPYTFNQLTNNINFENIDYIEYNEIEWSISFSKNQVDTDLQNIGVYKEYPQRNFNITKGGLLEEFNSALFELPYVGYYDVKVSLKDNYNNISSKIFLKHIKVEPYNIDIRGFYYDARNIPESLISERPYRRMFDDDYDSDASEEYQADLVGVYLEETEDAFYYYMKEFILDNVKRMLQVSNSESAQLHGNVSMPIYHNNYDIFKCNIEKNDNKIKISTNDISSQETILYYAKSEIDVTTGTKELIKFYNKNDNNNIRLYLDANYNSGSIKYTYLNLYFTYDENDKFISTSSTKIETDNNNPYLMDNLYTKSKTDEGSLIVTNNGPYVLDNMFEEWYLPDNVNVDITKLQPNIKYLRYIKNGVDVKPYTWVLLGFEHSEIRGKCNPIWKLTNTTLGKKYPTEDYLYDEITKEQFDKMTPQEKFDYKNNLPTYKGKYFSYLLTDEGDYTITLELDDINGNHYSISRNLFIVSKDANYKIYTPYINDYNAFINERDLKELRYYNESLENTFGDI